MDVLKEILNWSRNRPLWQRDALRRFVVSGDVQEQDIEELAEICKAVHGLSNQQEVEPLSQEHLPNKDDDANQVTIESIFHGYGVNALAENQTLKFGPALTVVYGDNAAGKSGYTRILKSACRARGAEEMLGNVLADRTPVRSRVSIRYKVGDEDFQEWSGEEEHPSLGRVSVFDSHSATVYLTEKTDVAFRPFGLDLFDKLAQACKQIRTKLEGERRAQETSLVSDIDIPEGTAASKLLLGLSSLTKPEDVEALVKLSSDDEQRISLLEKQIADLQVEDLEKRQRELNLRVARLDSLAKHLADLDNGLSQSTVESIYDARQDKETKQQLANELRESALKLSLLPGTGMERWFEMWDAARSFSREHAYPEETFPFTGEGARCLLCHQELQDEAARRLEQFATFVASTAERELREASDWYQQLAQGVDQLEVRNQVTEQAIEDIRIEDESLAEEIEIRLAAAETRRSMVLTGLNSESFLLEELPGHQQFGNKVGRLSEQLKDRIENLKEQNGEDRMEELRSEFQELTARKELARHRDLVFQEIERKKRVAAYGLAIDEMNTQSITMKSTSVTKEVVTKRLKSSFLEELNRLNFKHVEVELREMGGEAGNLYHKLVLTRAPNIGLPKVVSEGEQRCLSIAAFFAELSTADDPSAILFDDPVSSLDYKWREDVARRLVHEAARRQVVVFTHDIVFLLQLRQHSGQEGVDQHDQHVRQLQIGAGVCEQELPWVALPVKKRIGFLKRTLQEAEKLASSEKFVGGFRYR